jgi:hypothetical protein
MAQNKVLQSGNVTPKHVAVWTTDGVVQDGGGGTGDQYQFITVNGTPLIAGTPGRVLYDNGNTVGEATLSGLTLVGGVLSSEVIVGTTPVVSGSGRLLYDNSGIVGGVALGTGMSLVGGVLSSGLVNNSTAISGGNSTSVFYDNSGTLAETGSALTWEQTYSKHVYHNVNNLPGEQLSIEARKTVAQFAPGSIGSGTGIYANDQSFQINRGCHIDALINNSVLDANLIGGVNCTGQFDVLEIGQAGFQVYCGFPAAGSPPAVVTLTIASPCVVTLNNHGLIDQDPVYIVTTGALPTGLTATLGPLWPTPGGAWETGVGTLYYVKYIDANTFHLSTSPGGANLSTTGTQSGVHTLVAPCHFGGTESLGPGFDTTVLKAQATSYGPDGLSLNMYAAVISVRPQGAVSNIWWQWQDNFGHVFGTINGNNQRFIWLGANYATATGIGGDNFNIAGFLAVGGMSRANGGGGYELYGGATGGTALAGWFAHDVAVGSGTDYTPTFLSRNTFGVYFIVNGDISQIPLAIYPTGAYYSVVVGNAALPTNTTDGFLYIPTCAGAPTGVPTSYTGRVPMIYDTTDHKFYIYDGGWKGGTNPGVFT